MRLLSGLCALALVGGGAAAQGPDGSRPALAPVPSTAAPRSLRAASDTIVLSRRDAIAEALAHNAQLEVAREQTAQARARRVSAVSIPDPAATAAYDQLGAPLAFGAAPSRPVGLDLTIPFPDKFRLNYRIGTADVRSFESNYELQRQAVAFATSAAYDSLLVALRHRAELQEALQLATGFLQRAQTRYEAGSAPKLDAIRAQVDVAQARNDVIAAERDVALAQASLNRQLGRTVSAPIVPADTLAVPPPLVDSATIEAIALRNRPELRMLGAERAGASATTTLAREYWLPDLTFGVQRDYAPGAGAAQFTTGIALPLPVFFWQHARGEVAQAAHYERELAATERDLRAQITQDVRQAYASASTAMRQVVFLRDELVPAAREAYRVASTSYSLGGASALEVLDANRALLAAQSQLSDAYAAANTAYAALALALGIPLQQLEASTR